MSSLDAGEPSVKQRGRSARLPRLGCLVTLTTGALTFVMIWGQQHWQVLHPHYLPFVILITLMSIATVVTWASGLWRVVRGPLRVCALMWMILSAIPPLFFALVGMYAMSHWRDRWVPNNLPMNLAKVMGVALMRLAASIEYPNRQETERLIMFYEHLDRPQQDAEAMDRHLATMETLLGGSLRGKVFWVRGPLPKLGLSGLCTYGVALGSDTSPADWENYVGLDRHELAHAALDQFRSQGADPPYVLHEGWAQSRSGETPAGLAKEAQALRLVSPGVGLRELLGPSWYHRDSGPVYMFGGAFVDFLIRKHGIKKFLRFYNECRPGSFEAVIRDVFAVDIDALEKEFWKDATEQASHE